jgi:hypothetical protein
MLLHKLETLVKTHALIKSISIHFFNLATGAITLVLILLFFDIEAYGKFFQLLTFSLLVAQVVVAGFGNSLVADLSNNDISFQHSILKYYKKKLMQIQISGFFLVVLIHLYLELVYDGYAPNYLLLITIVGAIFLGANNKLHFLYISLPNTYNKFLIISSLKNISYIALVAFGAFTSSSNFLLLVPFLIEFVTYIFIRINLYLLKIAKLELIFKAQKTKLSIHAAWHALYFEYICKFDVLLFPFAMDPKTFGAYAILANANESIHALYASVRTQVTPMIRENSKIHSLPSSINLKQPLFVSGALLFIGNFVAQYILDSRNSSLASFQFIYLALALTTLVFYRVACLGFISIQRKNPSRYSALYALHTITNLSFIFLYIELNWSTKVILLILLASTTVVSLIFNRFGQIRV